MLALSSRQSAPVRDRNISFAAAATALQLDVLLFQMQFINLEGQVPVYISLRNRVAQLYPQALGLSNLFTYYYMIYIKL
jgi:hypothetical protein